MVLLLLLAWPLLVLVVLWVELVRQVSAQAVSVTARAVSVSTWAGELALVLAGVLLPLLYGLALAVVQGPSGAGAGYGCAGGGVAGL